MAGNGLPYTVIGHLGTGGTAEVVRIRVAGCTRELALKRVLPGSSDSAAFAALVAREKQFASGHRFPGIVHVYPEFCMNDSELAMALASGPTVESVGTIPDMSRALEIMSALAVTLAYVHASRIVHGDIKPHNFFLPTDWRTFPTGQLFYAKISDFAFSRSFDETDAQREGLGTFGYMAPETIREKKSSAQADLFSLGVLYYQLLSGVHPFMEDGVDPVRVNARVQEDTARPLGTHRSDIPAPVIALVQKLMEKDPVKRVQSAWEVALLLESAGSRYPLHRAITPTHFVRRGETSPKELLSRLLLRTEQVQEITLVGEENTDRLFRIMSWNAIKRNCAFNGDQFALRQGVLIPPALTRFALSEIRSWSFGAKRRKIAEAVDSAGRALFTSHTLRLVAASLRPSTVKRAARQLLNQDNLQCLPCGRTRLALMAGDLDTAIGLARDAMLSGRTPDCPVKAVRLLTRVIEFARLSRRPFDARELLMLRADLERDSGDIDGALTSYESLVSLYTGMPPDSLLAETYKDIGDIYKSKRQFSAGIDALAKARQIYESLGDTLGLSRTLNNLGNIYWVSADLSTALRYYRQALRVQRKLESHAEVASSLNNIGSIFAVRGNSRRALRLYELSLRHKREVGNKLEIARTLNNIGYVHASSGHYDDAIPSLQESLELNSELGNNHEILYNLENLTSVLLLAGRLRESLEPLKRGITLSEELADMPHLAVMLQNKGVALARMGFYSESEKLLGEVERLLKNVDNPLLKCELTTHRASIRLRMGDSALAHTLATNALAISEEHTSKQHAVGPLIILARLEPKHELVSQARSLVAELSLTREATLLTAALVQSHFESNQSSPPDPGWAPMLHQGVEAMREDIELPMLLGTLCELHLASGKTAEAAEMVARGIKCAEKSSLLPELASLHALLCRIRLQNNDIENAHAAVTKGTTIFRKISAEVRSESDREMLLQTRTYRSLAEDMKIISARLGSRVKGQTR